MKKFLSLLIAILLIAFVTYLLLNGKQNKSFEENVSIQYNGKSIDSLNFKLAHSNYMEFCAGCHGANLEAFVNRDWVYGKAPHNVFEIIKKGNDEIGMPGFSGGLTDKAINDMVYFLLVEGNDPTFKAVVNKKREAIHISEKQKFRLDTVIDGLKIPWGMEFLPNGDMLITEREGTLIKLDKNGILTTIKGTPKVFDFGQGGLLDIELHPEYKKNGWIYLTYSYMEKEGSKEIGSTALMRAKLSGNMLVNQELLYKAPYPERKGPHFGSRIEFDNNGFLFFSIGDRGNRNLAQDITRPNGKIHRLHDNGEVPIDNPFVDSANAIKSIYSFGHRNPQGMAMHPETGKIWAHEHGPKGGDELNLINKGINYGWPLITYGINYNGTIITPDTAQPGLEQPKTYWVPSIAPCGMTFVKGNRYKNWKYNILVGSLRFKYIVRVELQADDVVHQEILLNNIGRVRNVEISPDGYIFVATEKPGIIFKLVPLD